MSRHCAAFFVYLENYYIMQYEEALQASIEYFNGDELAARVFVDKYALRDNDGNLLEKTPEDMHRRIAKEIARIEANKFKEPLTKDEIFGYLDHFKYIVPQGRPMFAIGNPYQYVTAANCYVIEPPQDSYSSILKTDEQLVNVSKRGGGNGLDISNLRPAGTPTKNAAKTSTGIIPFVERYSNSVNEVGQSARRGALLVSLNIHHPEVLDFARLKLDKNKATGANLSVHVTQEFLDALRENRDYEQRWPVDSSTPTISKMVSAAEVWREIARCAHEAGCPGLIFIDHMRQESNADCYPEFRTITTNPCLPNCTKLLTKNGIRELKDINIGDEIWSSSGWTTVVNKSYSGVRQVYRYGTTMGCFYGTSDHKVCCHGEKIEAQSAEGLDILTGPYEPNREIIPEFVMDGLVLGDGSIHKASNNLIHLYIGQDDHDYFNSEISHLITKHRPGLSEKAYEIRTTITHQELPHTYLRKIPNRYIQGTRAQICSFLRGLYSANGGICGDRVALKTSSLQLAEDVQLMLSSIGIASYYTTNKPKSVKFANGEYECKQSYDVNITRDANKFYESISFVQKYKQVKLKTILENKRQAYRVSKTTYDIVSIDFVADEDVYDITVDNESHTFWAQGCEIGNCGEIGLDTKSACRLLVLNLLGYIDNPFTTDAKFNDVKFYEHCRIATRLQDDIIDLELELLDRIIDKIISDPEDEDTKSRELSLWQQVKSKCIASKRIGTGITGLADAIAAMNLKYDSEEAIGFATSIAKYLKFASYQESIELAKELGAFPAWNAELEHSNQFLQRFSQESCVLDGYYDKAHAIVDGVNGEQLSLINGHDIISEMNRYGRRHIMLNTCSPAGTISLLTQTSSGIEPVFKLKYTRRKKINPSDANSRTDFVDAKGIHWMEFEVLHPKLQDWMHITGCDDISKSPWYNCCAEDINWKSRIDMQSGIQVHIDNAISSTINVAAETSVGQIQQIYDYASKSHVKGITVYRQGSKDGVLVDKTAQQSIIDKRPKDLPCEVHHHTVKGKQYFVLVGLMNGTPYEVFAGRNGNIAASIKTGKIIRKRKGFYKAIFDDRDETELAPIMAADDSEEAITRLTSCLLRSGTPIETIVSQLEKISGADLTSFAKAIARALKKYIPEGTVTGEACPDCGAPLVRKGGCKGCSCGYSACD